MVLKAGDIELEELNKIIEGLPVGDRWICVETYENIIFDWFNSQIESIVKSYSGRIFSEDGELKWRKLGNIYRAVFMGSMDLISDKLTDFSMELKDLRKTERGYILWGERQIKKEEWIEQIVPHRFKYPLSGKKVERGRVKVIVEEWFDSTNKIIFSRFKRLEEIRGDEQCQ